MALPLFKAEAYRSTVLSNRKKYAPSPVITTSPRYKAQGQGCAATSGPEAIVNAQARTESQPQIGNICEILNSQGARKTEAAQVATGSQPSPAR